MVANLKKLKGKMAENDCSKRGLAKLLDLNERTVGLKMESEKYEFNISESLKIKEAFRLTDAEYLEIFIYGQLELNS